MRNEKSPIYKSSRSKATKTQQIRHYRDERKTNGLFLLHDTGISFNSRNNFPNLGSFAKISYRIYNSLVLVSVLVEVVATTPTKILTILLYIG